MSFMPAYTVMIFPLLAVSILVLFMTVPHDLPVHYYAFFAIQKVYFIITLTSLGPQNAHYNEVAVYTYHI